MSIPLQYVYLIATIPLSIVWIFIFLYRRDLRKEMMAMSIIIGIASVITCYIWWTDDWWYPVTLTGTKVGIEEFILGFATGGIMASIYEFIFRKTLYRKVAVSKHLALSTIVFLVLLTEAGRKFFSLSTFWASTIAMIVTASIMLIIRKDLVLNSIVSAVSMMIISGLFYLCLILLSPEWVDLTYKYPLSGIRLYGIPVEEFVFWFLAGFLFGPFYEYWKGEKLRKKRV